MKTPADNKLRVLVSAAAHVITQTLQLAAAGTALAVAQAPRLRQALTIGMQVTHSVRGSSCICHAAIPNTRIRVADAASPDDRGQSTVAAAVQRGRLPDLRQAGE